MYRSYLIMDGQWGSCGKGLLAGYLAQKNKPDVVVCNFGPNAGHTVYRNKNENEQGVMTQQLPTGIISRTAHTILIGPGSIINPLILLAEMEKYARFLINTEVFIHPRAAIVTNHDLLAESESLLHIASTRKGVGSALASKIMRKAKTDASPVIAMECPELLQYVISDQRYYDIIQASRCLQIESAQGLELSLNFGTSYPFCTSRDVTVEAILNDVGVRHHDLQQVYVAVRTYPIRVGNEYDAQGGEIGNSGPVYPDMDEMTWAQMSAAVGIDLLERTTVTKKVRRVFTWSDIQFNRMLDRVGSCSVFINFMNYLDASATKIGGAKASAKRFVGHVEHMADRKGSHVELLGWGPSMQEVEEISCLKTRL